MGTPAVRNIDLTVYGQSVEGLAWAIGETVNVNLRVLNPSTRAPFDLSGAALIVSICDLDLYGLPSQPPLISRQATITDPTNGLAFAPFASGDTAALAPNSYGVDIYTIDTSGNRLQTMLSGTLTLLPSAGLPGAPITVLPTQQPIGVGPQGPTGPQGPAVPLSNATPHALGTAAAGTGTSASRDDHVHPSELPAQTGQSGKVLGTNGSTVSWVTGGGGGLPSGLPFVYLNGSAQHITHNDFWKTSGASLGNAMSWERWMRGDPFASGEYDIADGYGGGHAILASAVNGNIIFNQGQSNEAIISFDADDFPPIGVFCCLRVSILDDPYSLPVIILWQNGIPVGRAFIPADSPPLVRTVAGSGSGTLFVGGSDHSNFKGWLAFVRAWDTVSACDFLPSQAYVPARFFTGVGPNGEPVDFMVSYIADRLGIYPDVSSGYDSNGQFPRRFTHPGRPYRGLDYGQFFWTNPTAPVELPTIDYITNTPFDKNFNENDATLIASLTRGYTPKSPPAGALLFDSFSRADQTFAHTDTPDFGSFEYCSFGGVPRWKSGYPSGNVQTVPTPNAPTPPGVSDGGIQKAAVGIYNRSAIPLDTWDTLAWGNANTANMTVEVTRRSHVNTNGDGQCGLAFRVQDEFHFWTFFFQFIRNGQGSTVDKNLYLYRWDAAGAGTFVASAGLPGGNEDFQKLRVVTSGNSIECFVDSTSVISISDAAYNTQLGAGLYMRSALARYYDLTVFAT